MIRHNGIMLDTKRLYVEHAGERVYLSWYRFRLVHALLLAGPKNASELFDLSYFGDPEGGPLSGPRGIEVRLCALKPVLVSLKLRLCRDRHNGRTRYWIEPAYDAMDDFAKSLDVAYAAIRERMAKGGPGWTPKVAACTAGRDRELMR